MRYQGWGSKVVSILEIEFVEQDRVDSVGTYIWWFVACLGSSEIPFMSPLYVLSKITFVTATEAQRRLNGDLVLATWKPRVSVQPNKPLSGLWKHHVCTFYVAHCPVIRLASSRLMHCPQEKVARYL